MVEVLITKVPLRDMTSR